MQTYHKIISSLEKGQNLFITGGAGSGKSYILRNLKQRFKKDIALTATTGVAAINIGGMTIHSFAKLGVGTDGIAKIIDKIVKDVKAYNRILNCRILAIDEISMLSAKFLNILNEVLQKVRSSFAPFGGVTVVFFGDFLQLPPIIKKTEEDGVSLNCRSWKEAEIETILLTFNYRQTEDEEFFNILKSIRIGKDLQRAYSLLKKQINVPPPANTVHLVSHREQAFALNREKLDALPFRGMLFKAMMEGKSEYISSYSTHFQDASELLLKKGARVMLNWNVNVEAGLCNGSIGNIIDFSPKNNMPVVLFEGQRNPVVVSPNEFTIEDSTNAEILFKFTQLPLQLAYGLTIHKAQGLTFKNVQTDISRCFAEGQAYVSLSRATTLEGLFLKPFSISVLKANSKISAYYQRLEKEIKERAI